MNTWPKTEKTHLINETKTSKDTEKHKKYNRKQQN